MRTPSTSTHAYQPTLPAQTEKTRATAQPDHERISAAARHVNARQELNVQILQASVEVSLKTGDQSQALLFRSAIDHINELLAPTLGADAIQSKMGEDNSAEATAARIVSLSTGMFEAYAGQRPGDDPDQVAKDFISLIRGGFEQGFNEAKDILKGLDVLRGDIESGIMKTYDLVNKGYDDFLASKLSTTSGTDKPPDAGTVAALRPARG